MVSQLRIGNTKNSLARSWRDNSFFFFTASTSFRRRFDAQHCKEYLERLYCDRNLFEFETKISNLTSPASILNLLTQQIQSSNVVYNEANRVIPSMVQKEINSLAWSHVKQEAKRLAIQDININLPQLIRDAANHQLPELARTHCTQIVQREIDCQAETQVKIVAKKLVMMVSESIFRSSFKTRRIVNLHIICVSSFSRVIVDFYDMKLSYRPRMADFSL